MFATCTKKKTRLIFWANFVAQEITRRFPKNTVFWSKTRCKAAAAPQIDKKHSWRCSPRLPFRPQVDFLSILGSLEGTPKPAFGTKCRLTVAKTESRISSRGHPGYLRCGFPSKITFWVVFTAPLGVQTPLQDAFWQLKVLKAGLSKIGSCDRKCVLVHLTSKKQARSLRRRLWPRLRDGATHQITDRFSLCRQRGKYSDVGKGRG